MNQVLVIDDDPAVLENLIAYLEDEGLEVISADDAEKAFELIQSNSPQVAIVDMRLPGMDGNELIARAHELDADLKFIIHTGSADYTIPASLLEIGMKSSDIIKKPVSDMGIFVDAITQKINAS